MDIHTSLEKNDIYVRLVSRGALNSITESSSSNTILDLWSTSFPLQ